jgi:hypothetical protein
MKPVGVSAIISKWHGENGEANINDSSSEISVASVALWHESGGYQKRHGIEKVMAISYRSTLG